MDESKQEPTLTPEANLDQPTIEHLARELLEATKPVPGYEETGLRYAGNEQMGFFPCIESGAVMCGGSGSAIIWPTLAHLRVWAHNCMMQKSNIVIPTGGILPPGGQPN